MKEFARLQEYMAEAEDSAQQAGYWYRVRDILSIWYAGCFAG